MWFAQWTYSYRWWQPRWTHCVSWRLIVIAFAYVQESYCRHAKYSTFGSATPGWAAEMAVDRAGHQVCAMECTWITAREETCSEGGGCIPDISILRANAFDDQLASEEVIWMFFLTVGVRTGLVVVTVEIISGGEIGTRYWTGKQGDAAVDVAEERPHWNLKWLLLACRDTKGVQDGGAEPYWGELF